MDSFRRKAKADQEKAARMVGVMGVWENKDVGGGY